MNRIIFVDNLSTFVNIYDFYMSLIFKNEMKYLTCININQVGNSQHGLLKNKKNNLG